MLLQYCLVYVTGSAKTCEDARIFKNHFLVFYNSVMQGDYNALCFTSVACSVARIFKNHFLVFYNSVMQGDYNALCFTSVACSVAKLRAPPFPAPRKKDWNNRIQNETSSVTVINTLKEQ